MAIDRMLEIHIFLPKKEFSKYYQFLKLEGKVEIDEIQNINGLSYFKDKDPEKYDEILKQIEFLIQELSKFKKKGNFIKDFIPERIELSFSELQNLVHNFDIKKVYEKIHSITKKEEKIKDEIKDIEHKLKVLSPYYNLNLNIEILSLIKTLNLKIGELKKVNFKKIEENKERCETRIISEDKNNFYILIGYKREDFEFEKLLEKLEFKELEIKNFKGKPKEIVDMYKDKLISLNKTLEDLAKEKKKESNSIKKIEIIREYYLDKKYEEETKSKIVESKFLTYIFGYIREKDFNELKNKTKEKFQRVLIYAQEPKNIEKVPVSLSNNKFIKPFEMLVNMYGYPKYRDFDPTPFLAPFFILFFSLCFGDVIYGLLLILGSFFIIKKFNVHEKDRNFFYFFIILGIFSTIVGVLTNSYAGDLISFPKLAIIDLLEEKPGETPGLIKMLIFSLAVGFITQIFGLILKALDNIRKGNILDAIFDQFSWIIALIGIILYIVLSKNPILSKIGLYLFISGILIIVLTGGRSSKKLTGKIIGGIVSLYGIVSSYGFSSALGDILSYSRLLALGFSTTVLGILINTIARMFSKGILALLIIPLILVLGHGLNIFMGLLGSFVHPTRLIFLEFFGRFYENGGKKFTPFKFKSEKVIIKN
ncbi:MAG: V-type ATP synthase subunit I [Caldisericia bacterium]|nr:V-type ATP synthase subunit I [Caldisericia bacterium]